MQRPAWRKFVRCKTSESRNRLNHIHYLHFEVGINVVLSRTSDLVRECFIIGSHLRGLQTCSTGVTVLGKLCACLGCLICTHI